MKASPFGNQATTELSSLRNISINLRGKGLECPAGLPGLDTADKAGDIEAPRPALRRPELPELMVLAGELESAPGELESAPGELESALSAGLIVTPPGGPLMTPAPIPLPT
jgi:hypothetical protein